MQDQDLFPWRAPLSADWTMRWKEIDTQVRAFALEQGDAGTADEICVGVRKLASQRLGPSEQLKLEGLSRRMLPAAGRLKGLRHFRIGLIGNRTLSYLINPLRVAGLVRGLLIDAVEAPYDSIKSFAFGGTNVFGEEAVDAVVVMLDEGAFLRTGNLLDHADEERAFIEATQFLKRIASTVRDKIGVPAILATLTPASPVVSSADLATPGTLARFLMRVNAEIATGGANGEWIVWDLAGLAARIGYGNWFDPVRFYQAKTPFKIELCPLVADHLSRIVAAMTGKSARALVLDLDNTLWGGVIGDDGLAGLRLGENSPEGEAYLAFQRFVLGLRDRGIVLAVCSKNTDEVAREPFRTHPEMLLREDHIAVFQANWEDKASNIKAIAESLSLGLESFVFVDDNPAERERVRQELPLVSVPEVGNDPAHYPSLICNAGVFEHLVLNRDDIGRAKSYEGNARRAELQMTAGNYDDYLRSLRMTMEVSRFDAVGRARIAQLINKSNQFNLTTRRYDEEDVRRFGEDRNILCWQARLTDTFSAHGMIAIVIVRMEPQTWVIDTWLQSCRVLQRGIEQTLMNMLIAKAREAGIGAVIGEFIPTPRNGMVADFYTRLGFKPLVTTDPDAPQLFTCNPQEYRQLDSFIDVTLVS